MKVLDFSTAHAEFTDEIINVANSNAQSLIHSLFYNKTGKFVEVWTGAGKTGTQLTITTDFTVGDVYPDASLPTSISPDVAYRSISIVNATYHNTDLYVSYYPISDLATAEKWNNDIPYYHLTGTAADFTLRKERQYRYNKIMLTFTRDASARTITLPDATDDFWKGVEFTIKVVGSGSGDVTLEEVNSVNINLTDGSTKTSLTWNGTGTIKLVSNGTDYDIVSHGIWDTFTTGATSGNGIIKKYTDGTRYFNGWAYINGDGTRNRILDVTLPYTSSNIQSIQGNGLGQKNSTAPTTRFDLPVELNITIAGQCGYSATANSVKIGIENLTGANITSTIYINVEIHVWDEF